MQDQPLISVLMSAYNAGKYLRDAIDSILNQRYSNFEFIIVNDGSTDASLSIIQSYNDKRIRLIDNGTNKGLIYSLNSGIAAATGKYIARMDADDISLPERLEKQVLFMESNPEVGVCGCHTIHFSDSGSEVKKAFSGHNEIFGWMLFNSSVVHPTLMIRLSELKKLSHYFDPEYKHAEDYELWSRLLFVCRFSSVDEVLFKYREHAGQVTQQHHTQQVFSANKVRKTILEKAGFTFTQQDLYIHCIIGSSQFIKSVEELEQAERWLSSLKAQNNKLGLIDAGVFDAIIGKQWFDSCGITNLGLQAVKLYFKSPLSKLYKGSTVKLIVKSLIRKFRK